MKKYYMIHRENGGDPSHKRESYPDICAEAKRLARIYPGVKFAILEAIEYVICELPEPIFHQIAGGALPKMRGKHPEMIIDPDFPQPEIFIVEDIGSPTATGTYIIVKPSLPGGMGSSGSGNWASLMAGDCLVNYTDKSIIRFWVKETPVSSTIKITCGGKIKKGDRLVLAMNTADREEENAG